MSNLEIDAIFGLMGQAKELQVQSKASQDELKSVARALPEALKEEIRKELDKSLGKDVETALKALKDVSFEAKSACESFKFITNNKFILHTLGLIAIAVIIAVVGLGGLYMLSRGRIIELAELKKEIEIQRITLEKLESATWNLELIIQGDTRAIVLPKGVEIDKSGKFMKDKSNRTVIILK